MPRPLRPIDDGLVYHVINRGNNRQDVFHKPDDFRAFLTALGELKERKPFKLYGYCLLNNHFHLLLRPTGATISRIMQSLLVSHTQRYHRHYRSGGHVWQGRFKAFPMQEDEHYLTVLRYVERNPLRANLVRKAEAWQWSSLRQRLDTSGESALSRGRNRVIIDAVRPQVDGGRYPIKRVIGENVSVEADAFCDGHDKLSCVILFRRDSANEWQEAPLHSLETTAGSARFPSMHSGNSVTRCRLGATTFCPGRPICKSGTPPGKSRKSICESAPRLLPRTS